jgi:hypothetical protein
VLVEPASQPHQAAGYDQRHQPRSRRSVALGFLEQRFSAFAHLIKEPIQKPGFWEKPGFFIRVSSSAFWISPG